MIIMWIITAVFAVISVLFFFKKGSFLIAGYNTASAKEKSKYDEGRLCRVYGIGMGIITILLFVSSCFGESLPDYMSYVILIVVGLDIVFLGIMSNTYCKKKQVNMTDGKTEEKSNQELDKADTYEKKSERYVIFIGIAICILLIPFLCTGEVRVDLKESSMMVDSNWYTSYTIPYSEINTVEYVEDMDSGSRTGGLGSFRLKAGNFKNTELGRYLLYAYVKCDSYVVIHTNDRTIAINQKTEEDTQKLYEQVKEIVNK